MSTETLVTDYGTVNNGGKLHRFKNPSPTNYTGPSACGRWIGAFWFLKEDLTEMENRRCLHCFPKLPPSA